MTVRAFIALTLPAPTRAALTRACAAFVSEAPEWAGEKWVAEANLHVTVKFLGGIDEGAIDTIVDALAPVCATHAPFAVTLGDVVAKPGGSHSRMLWARLSDGADIARALAEDVDATLVPLLGLEPEHRGYTPHITLVRVRRPHRAPAGALSAANAVLDALGPSCGSGGECPTIVSVPGASVMSSRTLREGPVYTELAFVPLGSV